MLYYVLQYIFEYLCWHFIPNYGGLGTEQEQGCCTGPPDLEFLNSLWGLGID
jgi:hypothetical protein